MFSDLVQGHLLFTFWFIYIYIQKVVPSCLKTIFDRICSFTAINNRYTDQSCVNFCRTQCYFQQKFSPRAAVYLKIQHIYRLFDSLLVYMNIFAIIIMLPTHYGDCHSYYSSFVGCVTVMFSTKQHPLTWRNRPTPANPHMKNSRKEKPSCGKSNHRRTFSTKGVVSQVATFNGIQHEVISTGLSIRSMTNNENPHISLTMNQHTRWNSKL